MVDDGVLNAEQVERVLARQSESPRGAQKRFGDIVVEMRLATQAQVTQAAERQQLDGK